MQDFRDIQHEHDIQMCYDNRQNMTAEEKSFDCCDCKRRIKPGDDRGWCSKCSETMCWRCVSEHDCEAE